MQSKYNAFIDTSWWRHQMETFFTLLDFCAGNSSVASFDVFFELRFDKQLSKVVRVVIGDTIVLIMTSV